VRTLPVFVSLVFVSLVFAADGLAQMPAQGPTQVAQGAGGPSQGAVATSSSGSAMSTLVSLIAAGAAATAAVVTSNTTTSARGPAASACGNVPMAGLPAAPRLTPTQIGRQGRK